jgi:Replication protein
MIASGVPRDLPAPNSVVASLDPPERPIPDTRYNGCHPEPGPIEHFVPPRMPPGTLTCRFRHSGWQHLRTIVFQALHATGQTLARRTSFSECGHGAYVMRSLEAPNKYRLAGSTCHDRFCTPCATERSRTIATNVAARLGGHGCRFVTLTVREGADGLRPAVAHLYASFRKLQRKAFWSSRVSGGAAFLEIKWNEPSQRWHPHLHCLTHGKYIPQRTLSELWRTITGGSYIVDIRACKGETAITRYVTKYASKPLNMSYATDIDRLCEAVVALKGKRICITFGGWRSVLLTEHLDEDGWVQIDSLAAIIDRASSGDVESRAILHSLNGQAAEHVLAIAQEQKPRPPPPATTTKQHRQSQLDFPPIAIRT